MPKDLLAEKSATPKRDLLAERGISPKSDSLSSRINKSLEEKGKEMAGAIMDVPKQNPLVSAADIASKGLGTAMAPVGAAIGYGAEKAITPKGKEALSKVANYISDSALGDVLRQYSEAIGQKEKEYPQAAKLAKGATNIAATVAGGKVVAPTLQKGVARGSEVAGKAWNEALYDVGDAALKAADKAEKAAFEKTTAKLYKDFMPKDANLADKSSISGPLNKVRIDVSKLNDYELRAIKDMENAGIKPEMPHQKKYEIAKTKSKELGDSLISSMKKVEKAANTNRISQDSIRSAITPIVDEIRASFLLRGDTTKGKAAQIVANEILKDIPKEGLLPSELLKFRQNLDKKIEALKGEKIFSEARKTETGEAVKSMRQALNSMVAEAHPQLPVLDTLRTQSNLLTAAANIKEKIPTQAKTNIGRAYQRIKGSAASNPLATVGNIAALVGAPAAAYFGAPTALLGAGLYGGYKALSSSPMTLREIGIALGRAKPAERRLALPAPAKEVIEVSPSGLAGTPKEWEVIGKNPKRNKSTEMLKDLEKMPPEKANSELQKFLSKNKKTLQTPEGRAYIENLIKRFEENQ